MKLFLAIGLALVSLFCSAYAREKEPYCYWDKGISSTFLDRVDDSLVTDRAAVVQSLIKTHLPFGLPQSSPGQNEELLPQDAFLTWYDTDLREPLWVAYRLRSEDLKQGVKRADSFRSDPRLAYWERSDCADYKEGIFDQGHLAPFADMSRTAETAASSFLMSNMSPQYCQFNRGPWMVLEQLTRDWAREYGTVWVISGTIFDRDGSPGRDPDQIDWRMEGERGTRVAIPSDQYKIIIRKSDDGWRSLSFIVPNTDQHIAKENMKFFLQSHISDLATIQKESGFSFNGEVSVSQANSLWLTDGDMPGPIDHSCEDKYPEY